jgi:hypothetical protein
MVLAIADFARIYTTMLTIEAAAREAADYGSVFPWYWKGATSRDLTEQGMTERACVASSNLTDYVGPDDNCSNPTVSIVLDATASNPEVAEADCWNVPRDATPCNVEVTLRYTFHLIMPTSIPFFDTTLGFPATLTFERTSVFQVSNFEIDQPLAPTPAPTP